MNNLKTLAPVIFVFLIIIALFAWGVMSQRGATTLTYIPGTNVACLPQGHQNLAVHIHPIIAITVDGAPETIPANIGIAATCMAEVHTHDDTGSIHIETVSPERLDVLSLADFFAVRNASLSREGYAHTLTVDGTPVTDPARVRFKDGQRIGIVYTSIAR